MAIVPNVEQFLQLAKSPDTGPVVMLNLLKFKRHAEGEAGSGADAYQRYGDPVVQMIEAQGGRVIWVGRPDQILIGDPQEDWDSVLLVWYPSRRAFIEMVSTARYREVHAHREHGLERSVVLACTPLTELKPPIEAPQ